MPSWIDAFTIGEAIDAISNHIIVMNAKVLNLTCEIELQVGETLKLPESITKAIGVGRWLITIAPLTDETGVPVRSHSAFLNGYSSEDEGLYDDCSSR
jgi:hypothetical protein